MKRIEIAVTIVNTSFKCCSLNGNPSYWVEFESYGENYKGYTASDASCGYGVGNYLHKPCTITYHITRTGNIIIDYIND